ncbi:hypothetical protein [Parasitella parasitica]|uniref:Uncharacterized protein n=1 Tax=Parasitella parasitica TaxID=35722 RepID=A0A0B7N0Q6_9FUNG|nr:hypothetical protein [Parasitella parasitica]
MAASAGARVWQLGEGLISSRRRIHQLHTKGSLAGRRVHQLDQPAGSIDVSVLVHENTSKTRKSKNQITTIGVNAKGFKHLLSIYFYVQMIRSEMEYGLAISTLSLGHFKKLESCQTKCIRRIFGALVDCLLK